MRTLILVGVLLLFFTLLKSVFKKRTPFNVQLLISMMFFGGIGFAVGNHYGGFGWAIFGAHAGLIRTLSRLILGHPAVLFSDT